MRHWFSAEDTTAQSAEMSRLATRRAGARAEGAGDALDTLLRLVGGERAIEGVFVVGSRRFGAGVIRATAFRHLQGAGETKEATKAATQPRITFNGSRGAGGPFSTGAHY